MEKLGTAQIPVAGSDAALKRKMQLELQVPPHDLDAALCDGLTETEAIQLQQYVQKLREQCVGQGVVVRLGDRLNHAQVEHVAPALMPTQEAQQTWQSLGLMPVADDTLNELLANPKVAQALASPASAHPKLLVAFSEPLCESTAQFEENGALRAQTREKLLGISKPALLSLVTHGIVYDKVLGILQVINLAKSLARPIQICNIFFYCRKRSLTSREIQSLVPLLNFARSMWTIRNSEPRSTPSVLSRPWHL